MVKYTGRKRYRKRFYRRRRRGYSRYGSVNYLKAKFMTQSESYWPNNEAANHQFKAGQGGQAIASISVMLSANADFAKYAGLFSEFRVTGVSVLASPQVRQNYSLANKNMLVSIAPYFKSNNVLAANNAQALESDRAKILDPLMNRNWYFSFLPTTWYKTNDIPTDIGIVTGSNVASVTASAPSWAFRFEVYVKFRNRF